MAQGKIKMNGVIIWQPDKDMGAAFATTYTEKSGRTQHGTAVLVPLFTVEQYSYSATKIPVAEASRILKIVAKGKPFTLHYFSVYNGKWQDAKFYVGQSASITIGTLDEEKEYLSQLSFDMQGVNPI